ncbi:MAG TPA: FG-GAP-like repeat-containing protein [Terriglobia bacterium]|nr:FG-GAP-like repeat-containing protein [Terriglobia bacterium]
MSKGTRYLLALILSLASFAGFGPRLASAQSYVFNVNVFGTGQSPQALVTADFNGDGLPDVAVANQGAKTVSILLGCSPASKPACTTGAAFQKHVDYAVGSNPIAIVAADFNGDGKLDLGVVNSSDNSISILIGNGDGTFQNQAVSAVGTNPDSIAAGDLNGDGKTDLVVANFNDDTISVLLGNGDGTFTSASGSPFLTGTGPKSVTMADFNKDGKLDVATADDSVNDVSILFGNGDGTLQACAVSSTTCTFATGKNPVQIVTADFNSDGQPDLATANSGDNNVSILLNNNGKFTSQTLASTYTTCTALVTADFNGDHIPDLAVTSSKSNTVVVLLGKGSGQFDTEVSYASGDLAPIQVASADINGDGHPDLVIANSADNDISVLLNNTTGGFISGLTVSSTFTSPISLTVADFQDNNIGLTSPKLGVATVGYSPTAPGTVSVLLGNGNGTLTQPSTNYTVAGIDPEFVASADLDNDGYPDLVVANFADSTISVLLNNGDGTFPTITAPTYQTGAGPTAVAVGDFNGDGKLDLAVADASAATVSILLGNGDGTFKSKVDYSTGAGTNPSWIVAADVNNDGVVDLVTADTLNPIAPGGTSSKCCDTVSVLLGVAGGTFQSATTYPVPTGSKPGSAVVADFNGDGMPDIATANLNSTVSVLLNIGSGKFGSATTYAIGGEGAAIFAGDLAHIGKSDLFVGSTASFTNTISSLLGNGDGTFQTHVERATGFSQAPNRRQPVILADFDNDGNPDMVASDENTGVVDIYLNQPQIAFSPGVLNFASQLLDTTSTAQTITVSNPGTAPITLTSFVINGDFAQTNTCPTGSLAVGGSCSASVTFTPSAGGTRSGNLTVTDNVPGSPEVLALAGTGAAPAATVAPTSLTFSATNIGSTSAAQTVTLTNGGTGALAITSIAASAQYGETNTCGISVAGGASCTISVTFTPTASGTETGTLTLTDSATNSPQTVALTGTGNGPAVVLSPTTVTFSSQPVGSTSAIQKVTLTNGGNQSLSITKITTSGPFAQTNNCGVALAAAASCTISIDFAPVVSGAASGTLTITDNAGGSPQAVTLTGTGSTGGFAYLTPAGGLTFPSTSVGKSASAQTVTLQNTGNATLSITSIALTGTNASDFTETNNCGGSLASKASCPITVTFKPAAAGNRSGAITVTSNGVGSPQSLALAGTGSSAPVVTLSPASIDFGTPLIGSKTVKTVTLTNSGNATLTVSSVTSTGSPGFTGIPPTSNCTSVAAGASCTITVTFDPSSSTSVTGSIVIADNATPATQTVALSGSGTGPAVNLAPTSLSFPGQAVKSTSMAQIVTLTNGGTSALSIMSVTVTGSAASEFTATSACGSSVAVGASCTISVTFSPTSSGNQSAALTITDNAANSPQSFSLSGGGADFAIATTTASQSVSAGQSGIYSLSLTPTGGFNQTVTLSCAASIPAGTCSISQPSLTLSGPSTVTVTATTTAGAAAPLAPRAPSAPGPWPWLAVLGVLGLGLTVLRRQRRTTWVLAAALALVSVWAACGGGSSSSTTTATSTPSGTYSLTVTATAGSLSNTTSLTLVVH